jgi:hypothetical protein
LGDTEDLGSRVSFSQSMLNLNIAARRLNRVQPTFNSTSEAAWQRRSLSHTHRAVRRIGHMKNDHASTMLSRQGAS